MIKFEILNDRVDVDVPFETTVSELTEFEEELTNFFEDAKELPINYNYLPCGEQTY